MDGTDQWKRLGGSVLFFSAKMQPKMKTCKLIVCGAFIFTLSLFTYVIYKQNFTFIHSVWFISKHPMTPTQIDGSMVHLNFGHKRYPWNGRSLQPLFRDMRAFTLQSDYDFLQRHVQTGGLNLTQMALFRLNSNNGMQESFYLAKPALTDFSELPNDSFCKIHILHPKMEYFVGETITIRIDLYSGYNQPLHRGGDFLMVWVSEASKKASMAVEVRDHHNGSYSSKIPIMWRGIQQIYVSVRYPREVIRAFVYTRRTMKSLRYVAAGFLNRNFSESTLCLPFPRIPGYTKLCNFTQRNYGHSWFCGHPRKSGLRCSDWKILRDMEFPKPLPLTIAEKEALEIPGTDLIPRVISQNISFLATTGQLSPPPPCDKRNFTHTWMETAPRGYYMENKWIQTSCSLPPPSVLGWGSCLMNTTFILAGDSNLLMWMHRIKSKVGCQIIRLRAGNAWHTPLRCIRPDINFSMVWQLHGYPEHPTATYWADITHFRTVCRRIDTIPARGNYVVIVHLYIHFSIHHSVVFLDRLRCIRRAIVDLLDRNPRAKVFIRAPFTSTKGWNPIFGGEIVMPIFLNLIKREFVGLYDRVILLNMWDMTLAGLNSDYHPEEWIDLQMAEIVLRHVCNN